MSNPKQKYHSNGQIQQEIYSSGSQNRHRTDGPAYMTWYDNGQQHTEAYWVNGTLHREDGPAGTFWDEDGNITFQAFYLNGEEVTAYEVLGDKEAFAWAMTNGLVAK